MSNCAAHGEIPKAKLALVIRRANWLLEEARQPDAAYDQAIAKIMRQVSNYATLGVDPQSYGAKGLNLQVSCEAFGKLQELGFRAWHKITTNEHQKPLKDFWNDILANCGSWTADEVVKLFSQWPMTTVTKQEDSLLRNLNGLQFAERYERAGIEIMVLDRPPKAT